jgi:hypothetical protein
MSPCIFPMDILVGVWVKQSVWGLGFGLCSARLQAGILLIPKCPPEGGRNKNVVKRSSHPDEKRFYLFSRFLLRHTRQMAWRGVG